MSMLSTNHTPLEFRGSPRRCGKLYGESQAEAIKALLYKEVPPDRKRLEYARRCWERLRSWEKPVVEFVRGMSDGSGLNLAETTLLLLHEEIVHMKNCTAFGATGSGTKDRSPVIGQNWDWSTTLYPWSGLLKLRTDSAPATLTYTYPGLWACAGINEHGLSLVWTSSGYLPKINPVVGIPTYALIAGIFGCSNCRAAIALLERTAIAGCFIFFLADARGEVWVVEGFPGHVHTEQCEDVISRANHYQCRSACQATNQRVPKASIKNNTRSRAGRMTELLHQHRGRIIAKTAEALLCDHGVKPGLDICQHTIPGKQTMTLDSFYALPAKREFRIARGLPCRHEYRKYRV